MYFFNLLSIISTISLLAYKASAWAKIGGYKVLLCDDNDQAERLSFYIPHIATNIDKVLADINLGTNSPHGFSAFFKSNNSKARVAKLFHDIALGTPISFAADESRDIPAGNRPPTIVCLNPGVRSTAGILRLCTSAPSDVVALAQAGAELIALCPRFWDLQEEPDEGACPSVRRGVVSPNSDELSVFQQSQLVHELAHLYGANGTLPGGWETGEMETYNVGDVIDLDEQASVGNAASYALYYSSVVAGCTKWPKRATRHDRELLEIIPTTSNGTI